MAYNKAGDGRVIKKGKTRVDVMPNDGPKVIDSAKAGPGSKMGQMMKAMGRNLARANNQKKGSK
jgi:hypothetical protein